ncbi:adenylosuccinate synthetase [Saccharothrix sp. 6-C]|uniref:adenylosuccinate synthetase n=1 Tax=Saccharothrix sp. 6-C TaxID=2781735 RepID=UPI0019174CA3|nr:adenylosuccinate synthetase [Saccharothrix sp. 6-C]QQQ79983.1 adenylosuccinate synthetase [Saccharothrix sp. 6-C]
MDGHVIVVGLGFGDEGKGAVVDALCHHTPTTAVVRFNGGAQAAHNVVRGNRHHTFSQFGSGTLAGVPTHLSRHVLVEPIALAGESRDLTALGVTDPLRLLSIDADALLTTPFHIAANRAREDARGHARHGSCGKGIGETTWYSLLTGATPGDVVENHQVIGTPGPPPTVGDCAHPTVLRTKLDTLARFYEPLIGDGPPVDDLVSLYRDFADAVRITTGDEVGRLADRGRLVFEGAQGVLLDQWRGFHPHTTWSTVTPDNARTLLGHRHATVLGVTRTYQTRHGAGPLPTEDDHVLTRFPERHNGTGHYQGSWRAGHLDAVLLRYAVDACGGVDALAVTHLDARDLHVATAYDAPLPTSDLTTFLHHRTPTLTPMPDPVTWLADHLDVPVLVTGAGPDLADYTVRAPALR